MSETGLNEEVNAPPVLAGDLTRGPILPTLIRFALPTLGANLLQTLAITINSIWVGQLLGPAALAATANANIIMFVALSAVFGFSMAAAVKIGQYFGAHELDAARRATGAGTGFCAAMGVIVGLIGWLGAEWLLRVLSTPPSIEREALAYLRVSFITVPFSAVWVSLSMALRGAGDTKTPFNTMLFATVLGAALNPLLILGIGPFPALGIAGAALASGITGFFGAALMIGTIYWRDLPLRLRGAELSYLLPMRGEIGYIIAKGIPIGAQMGISTASGLVMMGLVNREGMVATAAYGAVLQLWNYISMPAFALSTAVSAMAAQNIGAGHQDRVWRVTWAGSAVSAGLTTVLTFVLIAIGSTSAKLFLPAGSEALSLAGHIIQIATWSLVCSGVMMTLNGAMRAFGVVILPLVAMSVGFYPARLMFYGAAYPALGRETVWWTYPAGGVVALLLTVAIYTFARRNRPAELAPAG